MTDCYLLDANIIINLNRVTPRDVFPSVWNRVEELIRDERACIPRQVYDELTRIDDVCAPWARAQPNFVVEATEDEIVIVQMITLAHPGWVQQTKNEADPWLIANAVVHRRIVVTDERARGPGATDENLRIPNVAVEHSVVCLDFNDLARREDWHF